MHYPTRSFSLGPYVLSSETPPVFFAEIGGFFGQDIDLARDMIRLSGFGDDDIRAIRCACDCGFKIHSGSQKRRNHGARIITACQIANRMCEQLADLCRRADQIFDQLFSGLIAV